MYRFWLLAAAYGPGALADKRLEYNNGNHLQLKDSIITKQITFLLSLGKTELMGVDEVHRFLLDLAKWALVKHTTPPTRKYLNIKPMSPSSDLCPHKGSRLGFGDDIYLVWCGPAVTLDAFRGKWPSFGLIDPQWYGTWRAMTHAFSATEITSITGGRMMSTTRQCFILDDHFLKTVDCMFFKSFMIADVTYLISLGSQCPGLFSLSRRDSLWSFCSKFTFQ